MDLFHAIEQQRIYFRTGATRSLDARLRCLQQLAQAIAAQEELILQALHTDLRKSPQESFATEIGFVLGEIRHARRHLPAWIRPQRRRTPLLAWPARGEVRPEPYGVALILGPWNYPFQLLMAPLVGALAAGNCVLLKSSEFAPATSAAIARLIRTTFPPHLVMTAEGGSEVAEGLLRERFDAIFFTGSTSVGRSVMTAAARHLTPLTLELGGKSPCLVCADAPLLTTARRIVWGKFMNAGQTCVAPDFLLVDRRVRDGLVAAIKQALREFYGDDPQRSRDYSRIVNTRHLARLTSLLADGRILHGGRHHAADLYLEPTLLSDVDWAAPVMQDEIFGPILPVLEFDRLDDALARLRDRPTPLALYLFTSDRATQELVLAATRSGGVCLNDTITHMIGKHLPFGGLGESGFGAYHGRASFEAFTHWRSVLRRSLTFDPKFRYPPPRLSLAALKRAFRFLSGG